MLPSFLYRLESVFMWCWAAYVLHFFVRPPCKRLKVPTKVPTDFILNKKVIIPIPLFSWL